MPVGTKATVKSLHPDELRSLGASIVLGNTYHLHFRPGEDVIAELGGLHAFMGWDGPILTDSGGFQVFSLRDTLLGVDDEAVIFRSIYDGESARLTPEDAAEMQRALGSDIAMCLDVVLPTGAPRADLEQAVRRTSEWARRQRSAPRAPGQLRFGIAQGGVDPELRRRSIEEIVELDFDGNAIGGLAIGESREQMFETTAWAAELLARDKPRYFMGIGDPEGVLEVIARGVDMFDCVLPTRTARTGSALTWEGRLNLRNARFARDPGPLDESCACPACERFSRAYVRHLVNQQELLGLRLLSLHNLRFLIDLTAGARTAIQRGGFAAYRADSLDRLAAAPATKGQ
jgi:queuine tRNA-ribosyltransferase